jgi:hypothetical protein
VVEIIVNIGAHRKISMGTTAIYSERLTICSSIRKILQDKYCNNRSLPEAYKESKAEWWLEQ